MILYVGEFPDGQGHYHIPGADRDAASRLRPEDCDGVLTRWVDKSVNAELCETLLARVGAFYFEADGELWEDEEWVEPGVPG